jgi:leucyl aminopeptidase
MKDLLLAGGPASPIWFSRPDEWQAIDAPPAAIAFARAQEFAAGSGQIAVLPDREGAILGALCGLGSGALDPLLPGKLAGALPPGDYRLVGWPGDAELAAVAFLLGSYRFTTYRKRGASRVRLRLDAAVDRARALRIAESVAMGRDLIDTPANDLGPGEIAQAAAALARRHRARCAVILGDELLGKPGFPLIHAVGRASARAPRLVDIRHGPAHAPRVTLVGKGVAFDTGGLDIKPASGMLLMKKDMGGAATALAAARMIMDADLPVRLRVLLPLVENAVGGDAFRPGDVLRSRKGLAVEIGNTDAEGRLILADALTLGDEERPDLMIDFATLTGAARVALGPDLPPFFTRSDRLAEDIARLGAKVADPAWRLPLWTPYETMLDSKVADMNNVSAGSFAGSIVAALFLARFVEHAAEWAHFDIYGWTPTAKPARPEGGEPQAARLVYALVEERFGAAATRRVRKTLRRGRARQ